MSAAREKFWREMGFATEADFDAAAEREEARWAVIMPITRETWCALELEAEGGPTSRPQTHPEPSPADLTGRLAPHVGAALATARRQGHREAWEGIQQALEHRRAALDAIRTTHAGVADASLLIEEAQLIANWLAKGKRPS